MRCPELGDKDLAEFVGVMLGDGSIGYYECKDGDGGVKEQFVVKVTISKDEKDYSKYINDLFWSLFGVDPVNYKKEGENTLDIRYFGRDLFDFLTEDVGLKQSPNKGRAIIPEKYMEEDYTSELLKGLFDTDGSLVLTDNNGTLYPRLELKVAECPLQEQVERILEDKGFRFGTYECKNGKVRFQMNGKKQLKKWRKEIGFNNQRHLNKLERV